MRQQFYSRVAGELDAIERDGLTKPERVIGSRQGATVEVERPGGGRIEALNLCANNYLGLAGDPRVAEAAAEAARAAGAGMASVRFICGTHAMHKALEAATADVLGYEEAILFAAAFDANAGVFEPLLGEGDVVVFDSLNHASIIDGVRLCKADRRRFANGDMDALERELKAARSGGARTILIATDGVFSMDGHIAKLDEITGLADRYGRRRRGTATEAGGRGSRRCRASKRPAPPPHGCRRHCPPLRRPSRLGRRAASS